MCFQTSYNKQAKCAFPESFITSSLESGKANSKKFWNKVNKLWL